MISEIFIFLDIFHTEELDCNSLSLRRNNLKSLPSPSSFFLAFPVLSIVSQWLIRNEWNSKELGKPWTGTGVKNGFVFRYLSLSYVFILFAFLITASNKAKYFEDYAQ